MLTGSWQQGPVWQCSSVPQTSIVPRALRTGAGDNGGENDGDNDVVLQVYSDMPLGISSVNAPIGAGVTWDPSAFRQEGLTPIGG